MGFSNLRYSFKLLTEYDITHNTSFINFCVIRQGPKQALTLAHCTRKKGSKLYLGVEFRTFLIFDIKIGIGVTLSYN